ncbi:YlqD family protein [Brevibacillus nitrificans]|uniref:YlqD family protein n=1 Tax=Brevibacillus nitrificans TaxID=651560 RepID=UPI002608100E|nr:YlqD family protein [Brevibacillus nitrificans]MED1794360.1 YlqD family protein [Brevibacillus nitrificans]
MLTIFRSVQVKIIMTEASRAALVEQYARQIRLQRDSWEQWQFQTKKILADAKKKSADTYALAQEKVAREEKQRKEKMEILQFQLRQAENLPEGSEMDYQTVQSPVTVQIGDVWDEIIAGTEILIKDGQVHEIRQRTSEQR